MGYIYIISNPDYEKDVYKIGYTTNKNQSTKKDPKKALIQRYSTYSAKEPIIEEMYEINDDTCDQAEKILLFCLFDPEMKDINKIVREDISND